MPSLYGLKKAGAATSRLFVAALKLYVTFVHLLLGQADHSSPVKQLLHARQVPVTDRTRQTFPSVGDDG